MTIHLLSYTHSGLTLINEITPCFSPIKIYIPWGGVIPEYVDNRQIIASFPPEEFKQDADFNMLLNECFSWAYEQEEKSRKEIIKTGHTNPTSNESLRRIKTILANRISDTSQKDMIIRWHMLLHLANRLEENRNDANRMLEDLKKKPSPLLDNADLTENTKYPLENLRGLEPEFLINDTNIKLLLRAWHGLFNSRIDKGDILLTVDRRIFVYLSEEWYSSCFKDLKTPEIVTYKSPLFNRADTDSAELKMGNNIRNIVSSEITPEDKIITLKKLTSEFEARFREKTADNYILFSILFFQPPEKLDLGENDSFLNFLSGRMLIFAEKNA